MRLNTLSFTVHNKSLPRDIRQKLGLEPGDAIIETSPVLGRGNAKRETPAPQPEASPKLKAAQPQQMKSLPANKKSSSPSSPSSNQ